MLYEKIESFFHYFYFELTNHIQNQRIILKKLKLHFDLIQRQKNYEIKKKTVIFR